MRASIAVAILSLAAGIAPSVALPLPPIKSQGGNISKPLISKPLPPLPAEHAPPKSEGGSITDVASPGTPRPHGSFPSYSTSDSRPSSEHPPSSLGSTPNSDPADAKPKPLNAPLKSGISELTKSVLSTSLATGIIALSNLAGPPPRRELLERFDEQIKLSARAHVRELLTTPMNDLD